MATSKVLKPRRGSTEEHATFRGQAFEITFDTDKKTLVMHDGLTMGGFPLAHEAAITETDEALRALIEEKVSEVEGVSSSELKALESALRGLINNQAQQQVVRDADQDNVIIALDASLRALIADESAKSMAAASAAQSSADTAISELGALENAIADKADASELEGVVRSVNGVEADEAGNVALKAVITETWVSGTSWYRKWSDGWVEQGGQVSATANAQTTVTLHTAMRTANYTMLVTHYGESLEDAHPFKAGNRATSSFRIVNTQSPAITVGWFVTGK